MHKSSFKSWFLMAAFWAAAAFADSVSYKYDDAGRLIRVEYASGKTIQYTYDKAGNLLSRLVSTSAASADAGASLVPGIAVSTWVPTPTTGLFLTTRNSDAPDFVRGSLPEVLDGISTKVNSKSGLPKLGQADAPNPPTPDDSRPSLNSRDRVVGQQRVKH